MKEKSVGLLVGLIIGLAAGAGGYWATTSILQQAHSTPTTINTLPRTMNLNTTDSVEITTTVSAIQSYSNKDCAGSWSNADFPSTQLTLTVSRSQTCTFDVVFASAYNYNVTVNANVYTVSANVGSIVSTVNVSFVPAGQEAMNMETYGWNPNGADTYNVTLNLRNTGSASITLVSYYVKDSSGDQWARLNWQTDAGYNHPAAIAPSAVGVVTVTIGSGIAGGPGGQCGSSCTLSGAAFSFSSGYSYTIEIVTSHNNQFTFTVTR